MPEWRGLASADRRAAKGSFLPRGATCGYGGVQDLGSNNAFNYIVRKETRFRHGRAKHLKSSPARVKRKHESGKKQKRMADRQRPLF